jgi:hypothetical protein
MHVTWQEPNTLKLETDSGEQTRLFMFTAPAGKPGERTSQRRSIARWYKQMQVEGLSFGRRSQNAAALRLLWRRDRLLLRRVARIAPVFERITPCRDAIKLIVVLVRLLVNRRIFPPIVDREALAVGRHDKSLR